MAIVLITGSAGLIGSEAVEFFSKKGFDVVGIDNDARKYFFGPSASTRWNRDRLKKHIKSYRHCDVDIREFGACEKIFQKFKKGIQLIIHAAAQPSHDWAAKEPLTDFSINANGTLNLLELSRRYCPQAVFIFTSTNKVYGDRPNSLPFEEQATRWELPTKHSYFSGIDEEMSIDFSKHSLFGASKVAADILVQEYSRYFGMKTVSFRGGCLTGPKHSGAMLHGFLSYMMKCCLSGETYTIYGYQGKQVRDNIHSRDLVNAFYYYFQDPRPGEVYNIGGGRKNNCSLIEAASLCEKICGKKLKTKYLDQPRSGDHIWYITRLAKFQSHYPQWQQKFDLVSTLEQIHCELNIRR